MPEEGESVIQDVLWEICGKGAVRVEGAKSHLEAAGKAQVKEDGV